MKGLPKLSPRLAAVASFVRPGSRLLDVGCDHANLTAFLVGSGHCMTAIATDIRSGPCERARETILKYRLSDRVRIIQTDGLHGIDLEQVSDVVIAGMGGETLIGILQALPANEKERIRLVLQPQTDLPFVRLFLFREGYRFSEHLVSERHRLYHVFCADYASESISFTFADIHVGNPCGTEEQKALYTKKLRAAVHKQVTGLSRSNSLDRQRINELKAIQMLLTEYGNERPT